MQNLNKIEFVRPELVHLVENSTVFDLHFHSKYSDGMSSVDKIAARARALNIGIAITDHNEIRGSVEINKMKDILTIPGIEVTSSEGTHLLVYFYDISGLKHFFKRDVRPFMGSGVMSSLGLSMEELIERARRYPALVAFPHPYCTAYTGICNIRFPKERFDRLCQAVDAIEVINASNLNKWNLKCALLAFNFNKSLLGGSDGHSVAQMGRAVTYATCNKTRDAFMEAIFKGHTRVIGKEIDILRKVTSNGLKLKTNIVNYPDLLEKNLKYSCAMINLQSKKICNRVRQHFHQRMRKYRMGGNLGV